MERGVTHGEIGPSAVDDWLILVVDDDQACREAYSELIADLGYSCVTAPDALSALKMISDNPRISAVITDIGMPGMGGLTLLEELNVRFMPTRALVAIIITGDASMEAAISAMRNNAVDLLEKPVTMAQMAASLRRVKRHWLAAVQRLHDVQFGMRGFPPRPHQFAPDPDIGKEDPSLEDLRTLAAALMQTRQSRLKFFDAEVIVGPAWDILIDLAAAGLDGKVVPTSSACASSGVPFSTAFRHVNQLVKAGLVKRIADPEDKRRTLLMIEPWALDAMKRYLRSSWATMSRSLPQASSANPEMAL